MDTMNGILDDEVTVGRYRIQAVVDGDGHLNLYIECSDRMIPFEIETDQGTATQAALRFSHSGLDKDPSR